MYGVVLKSRRGWFTEAVVLTRTADRMRLFARGYQDAVELRRVGADWIDEAGEPVAFGFIATMPEPRPPRTAQSWFPSFPWVCRMQLWDHLGLEDDGRPDWIGTPGPRRPGLDLCPN